MEKKGAIKRKITTALLATGLATAGIGGLALLLERGCERPVKLQSTIQKKADYTLNEIVEAAIEVESHGNPRAERFEPKINDYSYGLGQILTGTARVLERQHPELPRLGSTKEEIKESLFDPKINRAYTTAKIRDELNFYNDPFVAIAAYNAGHFAPRNARNQEQLNNLYQTNLKTDGAIGPKSQEIVKRFQREYGLDDDGKIGPITHKKLQEIWTSEFPTRENPMGIIPQNNYTPNHVRKFKEALNKI
jgi:hypothetical protein